MTPSPTGTQRSIAKTILLQRPWSVVLLYPSSFTMALMSFSYEKHTRRGREKNELRLKGRTKMKRYQKRIQVLLPLPVKSALHPWDPLQDYHLFTALRISKSTDTPVTNLRSITSGEIGGSEKTKQNKQDTTPYPPRPKIRGKNRPDRKNIKSMKPWTMLLSKRQKAVTEGSSERQKRVRVYEIWAAL